MCPFGMLSCAPSAWPANPAFGGRRTHGRLADTPIVIAVHRFDEHACARFAQAVERVTLCVRYNACTLSIPARHNIARLVR